MSEAVEGRVSPLAAEPTHEASAVQATADDGLISFSVMWALALMFSVVGNFEALLIMQGAQAAVMNWAVLAACAAMLLQPRRTWLLGALAGAMALQYALRLPVASNNQTIAFFMNASIVLIVGRGLMLRLPEQELRETAYEQLRLVARYLLAIMYFYGIFHKINADFLDPEVSCAVALYKPLTQFLGLHDNLLGQYGSIAATFVVEGITLACLFWRRYFAVGLIVALVFHYIIPISAFSWYMDFSSLVFALYILSVPREVSVAFYARAVSLLRRLPIPRASVAALISLLVLIAGSAAIIAGLAYGQEVRPARMLWHSAWLLNWAVIGGVTMVILTWAALESLPYRPLPAPRQPAWIYALPALLFVSCLSPYVGLKTESSIAMFSNLQTEGGASNHLVFQKPVPLFGYQRSVAVIEDSSSKYLRGFAKRREGLVKFELGLWLFYNPTEWVTFTMDGRRYERATAASLGWDWPNVIERNLLIFKPVPMKEPRYCTH